MHLIAFRLLPRVPRAEPVNPALMTDLLWAHALADDGLEHVRVIDSAVVLFILAASRAEAQRRGERLIARVFEILK